MISVPAVEYCLLCVVGHKLCLVEWTVCVMGFMRLMLGNPLCGRVCHFSWCILPSSGTMSLAPPMAWAIGLQVIHWGQGQPSRLPASGVGQVLACDGQ